ncbi:MAG: DUF3298 domain-containing protein [Ruminococcus sp.]|nr:DUF3298 domain-containing protein [Ruminococcus sp.]
MNRITALALSAVLLTACTATTPANTPQTSQPAEQTTSETTSQTEETTVSEVQTTVDTTTASQTTETTTADTAVSASAPGYSLNMIDSKEITAEDNSDVILMRSELKLIEITDSEHRELSEGLSAYNTIRHDAYDYECGELSGSVKAHYEGSPDSFTGEYPMTYSCFVSNSVTRCDSSVFSFINHEDGYSGGAHGWYVTEGVNFDTETGTELTVSDICNDIPALLDILADKLEQEYADRLYGTDSEEPRTHEDYKSVLTEAYGEDLMGYDKTWEDGSVYHMNAMNFVFVPDGVEFFTNQYDITPYAAGTQSMTVLFTEAEGLFNEKYISTGEDFIVDNITAIDINSDGKGDIISYDSIYDDDSDDWKIIGYRVAANGKEYTADSPNGDYIARTSLERKDGKLTIRLYNKDGDLLTAFDLE